MSNYIKPVFLIFFIVFIACQSSKKKVEEAPVFNAKDLTGWHIYNQGKIDSKWKVVNEELICDPKNTGVFGDIITDNEYENFELEFEWKVSKGGNSGVFINVKEDTAYAATFATGLEMQLLDNANAEPRHQVDSTHWAGCLYAVECRGSASKPKSFNEWNQGKIRQEHGKVTFWLNGEITFQDDVHTPAFKEKVANTNMKNYPAFGTFKSGKIAFQNHTDSVGFRKIHLREL